MSYATTANAYCAQTEEEENLREDCESVIKTVSVSSMSSSKNLDKCQTSHQLCNRQATATCSLNNMSNSES